MVSVAELVELGFSREGAEKLHSHDFFQEKWVDSSKDDFEAKLKGIENVYGVGRKESTRAVLSHPQFAGLDHARVLKQATKAHLDKEEIKGIKPAKDRRAAIEQTRNMMRKAVLSHPQFAGLDQARVLMGVKEVYGVSDARARKAVLSHPQFASRDHTRVLGDIRSYYGASDAQAKKLALSNPTFAGLDHERVLSGINEFYGVSDAQAKKLALSHPAFAWLDHERVLSGIKSVYGASDAQAKKAVLSFPPFAGLDHARVLSDIKRAYGATDAQAKKAVLSHPPFAGLDHERVLRKTIRRARRYLGWDKEKAIDFILNNPSISGQSTERLDSIAEVAHDVVGRLKEKQGGELALEHEERLGKFLGGIRAYIPSPYMTIRETGAKKDSKVRYRKGKRMIANGKATLVKAPTLIGVMEKRLGLVEKKKYTRGPIRKTKRATKAGARRKPATK